MYNLSFDHEHSYSDDEVGITLGITVHVESGNPIQLIAKLDTGSKFCVFQKQYAELLGISLEDGDLVTISTVNGSFQAYGHEVNMKFLGLEWSTIVYFANDQLPRNFLGRIGFLDRTHIALLDYDRRLYLKSAA